MIKQFIHQNKMGGIETHTLSVQIKTASIRNCVIDGVDPICTINRNISGVKTFTVESEPTDTVRIVLNYAGTSGTETYQVTDVSGKLYGTLSATGSNSSNILNLDTINNISGKFIILTKI